MGISHVELCAQNAVDVECRYLKGRFLDEPQVKFVIFMVLFIMAFSDTSDILLLHFRSNHFMFHSGAVPSMTIFLIYQTCSKY